MINWLIDWLTIWQANYCWLISFEKMCIRPTIFLKYFGLSKLMRFYCNTCISLNIPAATKFTDILLYNSSFKRTFRRKTFLFPLFPKTLSQMSLMLHLPQCMKLQVNFLYEYLGKDCKNVGYSSIAYPMKEMKTVRHTLYY